MELLRALTEEENLRLRALRAEHLLQQQALQRIEQEFQTEVAKLEAERDGAQIRPLNGDARALGIFTPTKKKKRK